jgi:hypothetical protein
MILISDFGFRISDFGFINLIISELYYKTAYFIFCISIFEIKKSGGRSYFALQSFHFPTLENLLISNFTIMSPLRGSYSSWGQHFTTIMLPLRGYLKVERRKLKVKIF